MMETFPNLLKSIKSKHVYIQTHNFPDPDAIASAYALSQLLSMNDISSTIGYYGKIDRLNTIKMVDVFDIQIVDLDGLDLTSNTDDFILVDAQVGNSNINTSTPHNLHCIDHHPTYEDATYIYRDIRTNAGACASILAEYFFHHVQTIDSKTATALIYGIKVDTANLTRSVFDLDIEMFYWLYKFRDKDLLSALEQNTLEFEDLAAYGNAINSIKVYRDISFANTGKNCPEALIATISDFMLSLNNVHLSVVYSTNPEGIKLSVRSQDTKYDSGKLCNLALNKIGSGGGHPSMAGGFVPFQHSEDFDSTLGLIIQNSFIAAIIALYPNEEHEM